MRGRGARRGNCSTCSSKQPASRPTARRRHRPAARASRSSAVGLVQRVPEFHSSPCAVGRCSTPSGVIRPRGAAHLLVEDAPVAGELLVVDQARRARSSCRPVIEHARERRALAPRLEAQHTAAAAFGHAGQRVAVEGARAFFIELAVATPAGLVGLAALRVLAIARRQLAVSRSSSRALRLARCASSSS